MVYTSSNELLNICRDPFYMFIELRWEVIRFVDVGGIVDHHCLNFLFIICSVFFYNILWIARRVSYRKHELISPCEHMGSPPCVYFFVVWSVLLILLVFCVVFILFCLFSFCVFVQMLLLSLDCPFLMAPLVFSNLTFMQIKSGYFLILNLLSRLNLYLNDSVHSTIET